MRIENDIKLDYSDVLFKPKRSTLGSRKKVDLHRKYEFRNTKAPFPDNVRWDHYHGVPIMASNMDGVGTFEMASALMKHDMFTCLVKTYTMQELVAYFDVRDERQNNVAMSIGASGEDYGKLRNVIELTDGGVKYVCVDVANGYQERFSEYIEQIRVNHPELIIIAGNVVTADMTQELILNGADIVKIGIGPGSVCTTRLQTGVGYPQLSAVIECADAAHGLGAHIIADGGCTIPGDVAKAFGGGADFVMLGGMLAGHDQGGFEVVDNKVKFYGMSSKAANDKHFGGMKEYRASEGREVEIPYRGDVNNTVQEILGGLRSTCTYVGALKLKQLSKCTTFIRCNDTHNRTYE